MNGNGNNGLDLARLDAYFISLPTENIEAWLERIGNNGHRTGLAKAMADSESRKCNPGVECLSRDNGHLLSSLSEALITKEGAGCVYSDNKPTYKGHSFAW